MAKKKPEISDDINKVVQLIRLHNKGKTEGTLREEVAEVLDITVW